MAVNEMWTLEGYCPAISLKALAILQAFRKCHVTLRYGKYEDILKARILQGIYIIYCITRTKPQGHIDFWNNNFKRKKK